MSRANEWRPYITNKATTEELYSQLHIDELHYTKNLDILSQLATGLRPNDVRDAIRELTRRNWRRETDPVNINSVLRRSTLNYLGFGNFFNEVLPWIASNALRLKTLFPSGLPRLQIHKQATITLTAEKCLCILSAIFLGATPVEHWFFTSHRTCQTKLLSMVNYFSILHQRHTNGDSLSRPLTFSRIVENPRPLDYWRLSSRPLSTFTYHSKMCIEDYPQPCLQVDFANKYIGGGAMESGCVQEEICFMVHPELMVSILMSDVMKKNEAIVMVGAERFTQHDGYASSINYAGRYDDKRPLDRYGRLDSHFVAIDALELMPGSIEQYHPLFVERELNKAYAGFRGDEKEREEMGNGVISKLRPVCTGRWGCGVFGGDPQIKSLIQWAAASENERDVVFMTFGDIGLRELPEIVAKYSGKTVGKLISDISSVLPKLEQAGSELFNELLKL